MDTADTADVVKNVEPKRGRPRKSAEPTTPVGELRKKQAEEFHAKRNKKVVSKWYELRENKLTLCKKMETGAVHRTYVGSITEKKSGAQLRDFIEKLKKEAIKQEVTTSGSLRLYRAL